MSKPLISKKEQKDIALQRIKILFKEAEKRFSSDSKLAHRYVTLARNLAMKVKLKIPLELKRRFCKHCYKYLQPGVNSRVRTRNGKVIISCLECKKFMRILIRSQ
ncbi:ribonuclease P [Candidatus Woesearchaeota archaeon]|nr:ribonuclease P [Candidatus Woesearchaeota archaeon]